MDELIQELITDYNEDRITWHDIQDIVEGFLIKEMGGVRAYDEIPIRQRVETEDKILKRIEAEIYKK